MEVECVMRSLQNDIMSCWHGRVRLKPAKLQSEQRDMEAGEQKRKKKVNCS